MGRINSFDGTAENISLALTTGLVNGSEVRVSVAFGGLSATTTYWARVLNGTTVELYNGFAAATNTASTTGRIGLSGTGSQTPLAGTTLNTVDPDNETATFTTDPGWATGTGVRVNATGGGLNANITYFVRSLGGGVYSFFDTAVNATNTDADGNPLNGRKDLTAAITVSVFANLSTLSFENNHNWTPGTVVRVNATGGGLTAGTNYYVGVIDDNTISLHTSLANLASDTRVTFTAPITALVTPMFDGWCVDNDRFIAGNEYIANIYSSYDLGSFINTGDDPKDSHATEGGLSPVNTSMVPSSTNTTTDQLSFTTNHGWATQQAVRVTATDDGLSAGTSYYVRSINANTVSFHATAAGALANTDRIDLTTTISASTIVFRAQSIDFAVSTQWPNGSPVRVNVADGGLAGGTTYFARAQSVVGGAADANSISLYDTRENAVAGGTTGLITFADPIETITFLAGPTVTATDFATNETVDLAAPVAWADGDAVQVSASGGGLTAGVTYYVRKIDADTISFFTSAANAQGFDNVGRVGLSAALAAGTTVNPVDPTDTTKTVFYVPENLVEYPENLDVMNWVLNQQYESQLANGQAPTATTDVDTAQTPASTNFDNLGSVPTSTDLTNETVTFGADPGWATTTMVRVEQNFGNLSAATNYYVRNLTGGAYSFYSSAANATTGGTTGRINLNAAVTGDVFTPSLTSTQDTVTFSAAGFATGDAVNVTADVAGLDAATTYYLYNVGGDGVTFSFHTAAAATAANKVNLTDVLGTNAVYKTTDNTATVPVYGWATGMRVQVSTSTPDLDAGTDYHIRAINTTTIAFYATAADASNNVNRIDLTGAIGSALVRPYYTEGDVQRTVWELIENTPGDPGNWSPLRVAEILAEADAAVGLNEASVDFVPDCGGTVAIILVPFQVNQPSNEQLTIAQITVAQIPNYCLEGSNCQSLSLNLGSISGAKFEDMDGDSVKEQGDAGLSGWTVYLDANNNQALDNGEAFAVTGANGSYAFSGLLPGSYTVREVQQPGWTQTKSVGDLVVGVSVDDAAAPVLADQDLGNFELIDISGVKVWDIDRDGATGGINDAGDQRMAGVRIFLDGDTDGTLDWTDSGAAPNGVWDEGEGERWTTTDANGAYSFTDLAPGAYDVQEDKTSLPGDPDEWTSVRSPVNPIAAVSGTNESVNLFNHKFDQGEYTTYTIGGWGARPSGNNAGTILISAGFQSYLPDTVFVGSIAVNTTVTNSRDGATGVRNFFANKTYTTLQKQVLALTLTAQYNAYLGRAFGDLELGNFVAGGTLGATTLTTGQAGALNGQSIDEVLIAVNSYLQNSTNNAYALGAGTWTALITELNLAFDNGNSVTAWAERNLS